MSDNCRKIISILLSLIMVLSVFTVVPFTASAEKVEDYGAAASGAIVSDEADLAATGATSGTTGDCTWTLDDDGVLTISGNGKMEDYSWFRGTPWRPNLTPVILDVTKVIIEDGVTNIGGYAFQRCDKLTSITIPNSVTSIKHLAFVDCRSLKSIKIPDSVTSIGSSAFFGCSSLTSVTIPDSVKSIDGSAFSDTAWYNNQPDGLVYAGKVAYQMKGDCPAEVIIKDGTWSISGSAFYDCTGLTSITIPDSVTSIGRSAFSDTAWYNNQPDGLVYAGKVAYQMKGDCPGDVIIQDGTLGIADDAFYDCTGLTSITIPDSVTSIGSYAFEGCTGLTSVTIPDSVTSIGDSPFYNCTGLKSVTIPDSVTSIGNYAFYGCTGLTSVTIPDSVTRIDEDAFFNCTGLTSVTIPDSVTSIGDSAFGYYYNDDWETSKADGFTIYGYAGTAAETYANENGFTFIALSDKADGDTGIVASVTADIILDAKDITGTDAVGNIQLNGGTILKAYDITLTKGGAAVQPGHTVTVKIPCAVKTAKVYRVEADGSLTDMHAVYRDGYLVFATDHFSLYVVAEGKTVGLVGDVDGDGEADVSDATWIQRSIAKMELPFEINTKTADVDGSGTVDLTDATLIQKWVVSLKSGKNIGKEIG